METDSPMEPLARALYALDLADFTLAELPDEALLAAREGLAFEVPVPKIRNEQDRYRLSLRIDEVKYELQTNFPGMA